MSKNAITNYLKALYTEEASKGYVSTGSLARRLKVSTATASVMLRRLETDGVVRRLHRGSVSLTPKGRASAERIVRKHRLVETFLYEVLGYSLEELHPEAAALEAVVSDRLEERIDTYLGYPERDPHGHRIPPTRQRRRKATKAAESLPSKSDSTITSQAGLAFASNEIGRTGDRSSSRRGFCSGPPTGLKAKGGGPYRRLDAVSEGSVVRVSELDDEEEDAVSRLVTLGILPNRRFRITHIEPYGGPVWLEGDGGMIPLARGLAQRVRVEVLSKEASSKNQALTHRLPEAGRRNPRR